MDDTDDLLDDFFNLGPPKREYVKPKPSIEPLMKKIKTEEIFDYKRESRGTDYAARHKDKEQNKLAAQSLNMASTSGFTGLDDEDVDLTVKEDPAELPELEFFQRYQFDLTPQKLPILETKKEILSKIKDNMVTVLTAATGTGKSSQVPQYILENARKRNENCNIIVTQPRRIAGELLAL